MGKKKQKTDLKGLNYMQRNGSSVRALRFSSSTLRRATVIAIQNRVFASLAGRFTLRMKESEARNRNIVVSRFQNDSRIEHTCGRGTRKVTPVPQAPKSNSKSPIKFFGKHRNAYHVTYGEPVRRSQRQRLRPTC